MTGKTMRAAHEHPQADGPAPFTTLVELTFQKRKVERWIRFGRKSFEQIIDRRRSLIGFAPESIFAFVRWASNDYGTIVSRLDILRAVGRGEPYQTVPFVRPGGEILLRNDGWRQVQRVLALIDAVDALGVDPADVAPDHWRHVHNRLSAGQVPTEHSDAENAPDYRVHYIEHDGPEVGAAWKRTGEKAGEYLSVLLDDPALPQPIRANLFRDDDAGSSWSLHWSRPRPHEDRD